MKERLRILCDCDGVVADFNSRYLECLSVVTGQKYRTEDVITWYYTHSLGITPKQEQRATELLSHNLDFEPFEGSVEAVSELAREHDVVFVTAPHRNIERWAYARQEWLEGRFPGIPIVHTHNKELIDGDIIIDDRPENIERWLDEHPFGTGVLWTRPYNESWIGGHSLIRTNSWSDLLSYVGRCYGR